ncbi:MAG: type II toxin-antitoxin system HicA family toxin [Gemmatimonadota bacterium]
MPALGPIKRRDLVRHLSHLGFEGPFSGGKHEFMVRGDTTLRLPNPHQGEIGKNLPSRILKQAGIERKEWEEL